MGDVERIYNSDFYGERGLAPRTDPAQPTRVPRTNSPPVVITTKNRFPRPEEKKGFFGFLGFGGKKSRKYRKSKKSRKSRKSRKSKKSRKTLRRRM